MSSEKRTYTKRARAEREEETRRRIAAATASLHEEVGPARTTVAEIARRAGVTRLTVYNHFPEDTGLFAACQAHFLEVHPFPDLSAALALADPAARLRAVLVAIYGWYRETEAMTGNVARDRGALPALDALLAEHSDPQFAALADTLAPSHAARPLVALALDFWTWRRLSAEGLTDARAADLMVATAVG
jgi:AcrR family transcriptional regulator